MSVHQGRGRGKGAGGRSSYNAFATNCFQNGLCVWVVPLVRVIAVCMESEELLGAIMDVGFPDRFSLPTDQVEERKWDGYVKIRLGHSKFGSVLVPDALFVKVGSWRFFQPSFFGPPLLVFGVEQAVDLADFNVDVGSPLSSRLARLRVRVRSDGLEKRYNDGAMLYRCQVLGPEKLAPFSGGRCLRLDNGDFIMRVYHHTDRKGFEGISASGEIWSSSWNLQGTRRLSNVSYVYFTTLPKISNEQDLQRIAMASEGKIRFQTTSMRFREEVLELDVYRESTNGRLFTKEIDVPSEFVAPPHLLFHQSVLPNPAYYEVVCPEIVRVGVQPGKVIQVSRHSAAVEEGALKSFEYIVMGNANELAGLAAPYDEEESEQVMHLEPFRDELTPFEFWKMHQNSDQVSGRMPEPRIVEPRRTASEND